MRVIALVAILTIASPLAALAAGPANVKPAAIAPRQLAGDDVMARAFQLLMQAAADAREDLKAIMDGVKEINKEKEGLRNVPDERSHLAHGPCAGARSLRDCIRRAQHKLRQMEVASVNVMRASVMAAQSELTHMTDGLRHAPEEADRIRNHLQPPARILPFHPCKGWNVGFWRRCIAVVRAELAGNLLSPVDELEIMTKLDALEKSVDAMGDLSEMNQLQLQIANQRLSKLMSTLSNMLRKMSDIAQQLTQNLK